MKSKFLGCCIITALAISSYAWATWVQFGTGETTETTILESNDSHTIVEFTVPGMDIRDTVVDGTTYQIVSVSTAGIPGEVGKPQTPVISKTVAIHPSKGVQLNILQAMGSGSSIQVFIFIVLNEFLQFAKMDMIFIRA
ncbi:hypothetical protein CH333_05520 [candidate division WOR-3 bacterium JGI_Cruoil_03_44_89]|uniref:Gingipain propeptide domain-containing protein n=1 Tax=candidate division WOR-3 bacterium JGI_Cruoil_03_44_89 TaxID=1973748 RepID=A0A235BTZ6_UNCW3|nr:MAG: hypothetical protein CH333_05520 [candidate division WOR-3 bacterium JGI_Cruoil_03_44_89]